MTRTQSTKDDIRYRVLALLEKQPAMSQRELARALGISLGGVNYCLKALIDRGMIKMNNFSNSANKVAYAYLLTPQGAREKSVLAGQFLIRKMHEYEALKAEIEALQLEYLDGPINK
jgi:EPS-associated MarR family transcriptional regulator